MKGKNKGNFNKKKKNFKSFKKLGNKSFGKMSNIEPKNVSIENVDLSYKGNILVFGIVNRVVQTGGPTIFVVSDGTGSLSLKVLLVQVFELTLK